MVSQWQKASLAGWAEQLPLIYSAVMITSSLLPLFGLLAATLGNSDANRPTDPPAHPHHPKMTQMACVNGKISLSWFTVPFNAEQVAKNKRPNYLWNRGFTFETSVALTCGDVSVPVGSYALGFQLDAEAKDWGVILLPSEGVNLKRQLRNAKRRGNDTAQIEARLAEFKKKGLTDIALPCAKFAGAHAEHMAISLINNGYQVSGRRDPKAASGVDGEFRVSFGDLHTSFKFEEVFTAPKKQAAGSPARRRR